MAVRVREHKQQPSVCIIPLQKYYQGTVKIHPELPIKLSQSDVFALQTCDYHVFYSRTKFPTELKLTVTVSFSLY
jgi:hypothetical protein